MLVALLIFAVTIALMIASILFFPKLRLGKFCVSTYWLITLLGAAVMLLVCGNAETVGRKLIEDSAINPLKILVLFLSMTVLSVFLDELGLFRFLASVTLKFAHGGQKRLFFLLYLTVSVLTVFTSNDIIILSFTPFLCYFCKSAKIDPKPYLAAEFVAANTWSMALVIGNPTNIYLSAACGLSFLSYLKLSALPTLFAGITALLALWLLFRKKLKTPADAIPENVVLEDKPMLFVGIAHLAVCTVLLAVGPYLGIEMWLVSLCAAGSLFLCAAIASAVRRKKPNALIRCLKRAPYELVPFVLSMFAMIVSLSQTGVTSRLSELLSGGSEILNYGAASFLTANIINNIPMSVLFSSILESGASLGAVFATIIGSNLGAFFTPIGALAGIMFGSILETQGIRFGYLSFLRIGVCIALPTLLAALGGLALVL